MATAYTIPSRLARAAKVSSDSAEARTRAIRLYRDWYRAGPEIVSMYYLNVSPVYYRNAIRQRFERNRYVTDIRAIDVLLLKSKQDYQETMNLWKLHDHVASIQLVQPKYLERQKRTFLQNFYEGRDENTSVPSASGVP